MMMHLAKQIVSDGEGASKFIEYEIVHAPDEEYASKMIRAISTSSLVKTAMFGRDPNWGRIISAAGNAGLPFDYEKVSLFMGSDEKIILVLENGVPAEFDRNFMKKLLRESHIKIKIDLHNGKGSSIGWGTDLTTDYVLFNSVYTT
jgi:glutamate N-acetyltransferase/amino-acid N-acetyltransferase